MYTLIVENKYGQQLELTHNTAYSITDIDGLQPSDAIINSTKNANADGSVYNSSYTDDKTIIITMAINAPVELNRINLYRYFKSKFPVRLFYKNNTRDVYIDGYVQRVQIGFFDKKQTVQITIFCPEPYFKSVDDLYQDFANVESLFEFPFDIEAEGVEFSMIDPNTEQSIINGGDVDTGVIISIHATGPVITPKIYNVDTGESMIVNVTMADGDDILIDTRRNRKGIHLTSNGVTTNIIGDLADGSTWFQLIPGDNLFTITADATPENMQVSFTVTELFEGV